MSKGPGHHTPNKHIRGRPAGSGEQAYLETSWRAGSELQQAFVNETQPDKKSKIVDKLFGAKQVKDLHQLGAMCIEMARDEPDKVEDWLAKANDVLHEAVQACTLSGLERSADRAKAQRLIGSMPHYYSVLLNGKLPSSEWNAKMYASILTTAQGTLGDYGQTVRNSISRATADEISRRRLGDLTGEMAEESVHLLALRAASVIGPETWSPAPAHFSEDNHARVSNSYLQRSWDLTVQTQVDESPIEDTYLLQVKASEHEGRKHRKYTDDVVVVRVSPDLALNGESLRIVTIIKEMLWEQQGDQEARASLDARQDQLLELLG